MGKIFKQNPEKSKFIYDLFGLAAPKGYRWLDMEKIKPGDMFYNGGVDMISIEDDYIGKQAYFYKDVYSGFIRKI